MLKRLAAIAVLAAAPLLTIGAPVAVHAVAGAGMYHHTAPLAGGGMHFHG